ncbi:MAG: hypothetical protein K5945_00290 [Bacteroidaceae bacterium]|nr:hypothetical protein [Bacteroidaceae bacterium]
MRIRRQTTDFLLTASVVAASILPFASWILSLLGLPVRSMFSDEGLRWLFLHGAESMFSYGAMACTACLVALGSVEYSGMDGSEYRRTPFLVSLFFAAIIDALLLLAMLHPHSPLISLTGSLWPSPFLHGLPFALCIGLQFVALIYALQMRRVNDLHSFVEFLVAGLVRYAPWIVFVMLTSFVWNGLRYIVK